jgi:23S rRNA (cytidine1920-2'-O)/16S rRNA (cytidine1409-2'-O)-methyltransferase
VKKRLDILLYERGMFESREKAKTAVISGIIYTDNELLNKPGMKYDENIKLYIKGEVLPYVSRGGLKLEKALKEFNINLKNKIMLDVGCSTGGFTDVALQNGVKKVYALDVGTNCLDYKLRSSNKVVVMENTNFRYSKKEDFEDEIDIVTFDVSFISLRLLLEPLVNIIKEQGEVIALIKPQFESTKEIMDKYKGIINNKELHKQIIEDIIKNFKKFNFFIQNLAYSPIKGKKGNIEFLGYFIYKGEEKKVDINKVINEAHHNLNTK